MNVTKRITIKGDVQGVGFRYSMLAEARRWHILGWVRNGRDGSVEAVVQGAAKDVQAILSWAAHGPDMARVEHVEIQDDSGVFVDFRIEHTI
jgi:acylphosphatase